jgi:co-chaperonin GroES (HSP10)
VAKLIGKIIYPTIGNVLLQLQDTKHETIILPDKVSLPTTTALVVGPGSSGFKRGDLVSFQPSYDDLEVEAGENLRMVLASQVLGVIQ